MKIIINDFVFDTKKKRMTRRDVIALYSRPEHKNADLTVMYKKWGHRDSTLFNPGESVEPKEGMTFSIFFTRGIA